MEQKREYTGTFIPAAVMLSEELTPTEKILYAEIASFVTCYAGNKWLSERVGVSTRTVTTSINKLIELGFIATSTNVRGNRVLIPAQNLLPPLAKFANPLANSANIEAKKEEQEERSARKRPQSTDATDLLAALNEVTGRRFRVLPRGYKKLLAEFTVDEVREALGRLVADPWHKERISSLGIEYLLRVTTIDRFSEGEGGEAARTVKRHSPKPTMTTAEWIDQNKKPLRGEDVSSL